MNLNEWNARLHGLVIFRALLDDDVIAKLVDLTDRMAAALYGIPGLMVIPRGPDLGAQVVLKRKWEKRHWQEYYDRGGKTL